MDLPNHSQRISIMGATGSGKTRAAMWHLSMRPLASKIWVVLNHKGEEMIDSIEGANHVGLEETPKRPGIYVYHPIPDVDDDEVTNLMWRMHARENMGLYIDEGYMIDPFNPALNALYTQGRSKHIPMVTLTQRPVFCSRFAISEADFLQVFRLQDDRDRKTVDGFIPTKLNNWFSAEANTPSKVPPFHSLYYNVAKNKLMICKPVPSDETILNTIEGKIKNQRKTYFL